jgi:hypothetical protein
MCEKAVSTFEGEQLVKWGGAGGQGLQHLHCLVQRGVELDTQAHVSRAVVGHATQRLPYGGKGGRVRWRLSWGLIDYFAGQGVFGDLTGMS